MQRSVYLEPIQTFAVSIHTLLVFSANHLIESVIQFTRLEAPGFIQKYMFNADFLVVCFRVRECIRRGLEELHRVHPGGDTFMHEGLQRVSVLRTSSCPPASSFSLLWLRTNIVQRARLCWIIEEFPYEPMNSL